jgi:hypothetical protein
MTETTRSWVSSVSIGLAADWMTKESVQSQAEAKDFSCSFCVQTGSWVHPVSYPMGTRGPFARGKVQLERDADHSPHLLPRSRMSRSYTSSRPKHLHDI